MAILHTTFLRSSHPLCTTSFSFYNPQWRHQNPFWCCEEGMGTSVCVCVSVPVPSCHSRSFPTKRVPALCVCWLTGPKERRLFSAYPETLPCQVWDEILSIVLTPHSWASHSKTHTITAPGGRVIAREKSVRGLFYTNTERKSCFRLINSFLNFSWNKLTK